MSAGTPDAFADLWKLLFTTPIHLDSALSKQTPSIKSDLARIVPSILMRPVSMAQELGIGVPKGEPWALERMQLPEWRPAQLMAENLEEAIRAGQPIENRGFQPAESDFPPWMLEEWRSDWGDETTHALVDVLARPAPLSLRAGRKIGAAELLKRLSAGGRLPVRAERSPLSPLGVRLSGFAKVMNTPEFVEGQFEIQDEGSQVMALFAIWPELFGSLLGESPAMDRKSELGEAPPKAKPMTVVDACAGAGGKSLAIADALGGAGRVFAYDTVHGKLQALRKRSQRAGFNNIQVVQVEEGAESATVSKFEKSADVVLVDAPCSGWGVLRRNPDIKWRQSKAELERMPVLQGRLLDVYSQLVKPGGRLVFGVCTFRKAETLAVAERFQALHPEFRPLKGGYLGPRYSDGFYMQSWSRE